MAPSTRGRGGKKAKKAVRLEPGDQFSVRLPIDIDERVLDVLNHYKIKGNFNQFATRILLGHIANALGLVSYRTGDALLDDVMMQVGGNSPSQQLVLPNSIIGQVAVTRDTGQIAQPVNTTPPDEVRPAAAIVSPKEEKSEPPRVQSSPTQPVVSQEEISEERRKRMKAARGLRDSISNFGKNE